VTDPDRVQGSRSPDRTAHAPSGPSGYTVLGTHISSVTFAGALRELLEAPAAGRLMRVHFCTTHGLVEGASNRRFQEVLNGGDVVAPDGMPLVWLGRRAGRAVERVCGPDLMPALMDRGRASGARHYLYGGAPGVAERLAGRMRAKYPGVEIVGVESPPFRPLTEDDDRAVVRRINAARPDYVWVGLGTPKQDVWLAEHRAHLDASVLLAVGAAFDYLGGTRRRAPRALQRSGLEWLWRLAAEPRRLGRRYTVLNLRFLWLLARDWVRSRFGWQRRH
jgi:N-acetylglucosaminyldiphosphoundecaprenol N-acetyl-beta-D-mannosaminyltransferase